MVWRRLFHRDKEPEERQDAAPGTPAQDHDAAPPIVGKRKLPGHLAEQLAGRQQQPGAAMDPRRKLARLKQRRNDALYDIEQGELARAIDNPWQQRVALLTEALETVEHDRAEAEQAGPGSYHPVPATPVTGIVVTIEHDVATIRFTVDGQTFVYEEPQDWAERGHQIARHEPVRTHGEAAPLVPADTPPDLRDALQHHLEHSLFVLASELRDLSLEHEPLPDHLTLADLAKPCPECGGWTDYRGRCQHCARQKARLQELFRERDRFLSERAAELEEEHRLAERLPLARKRLADTEAEIATLEQQVAGADNR